MLRMVCESMRVAMRGGVMRCVAMRRVVAMQLDALMCWCHDAWLRFDAVVCYAMRCAMWGGAMQCVAMRRVLCVTQMCVRCRRRVVDLSCSRPGC